MHPFAMNALCVKCDATECASSHVCEDVDPQLVFDSENQILVGRINQKTFNLADIEGFC